MWSFGFMSVSKILAFLKLRFDLGSIFLTIANFVLLIIATAPKFIDYFSITVPHGEMFFIVAAVPVAFLIMLVAGQVLIWMRYMENYATETNIRNPIYAEIIKEIREVKEEVKNAKSLQQKI
jgi:ABC-type uncharacterized transport system fused permease/ATPase subunit